MWEKFIGENGDGAATRIENIEKNMVTQSQCAAIQNARVSPRRPKDRSPHIKWNDRLNRALQILTLAALLFAFFGLQSEGVMRRIIAAVVAEEVAE